MIPTNDYLSKNGKNGTDPKMPPSGIEPEIFALIDPVVGVQVRRVTTAPVHSQILVKIKIDSDRTNHRGRNGSMLSRIFVLNILLNVLAPKYCRTSRRTTAFELLLPPISTTLPLPTREQLDHTALSHVRASFIPLLSSLAQIHYRPLDLRMARNVV